MGGSPDNGWSDAAASAAASCGQDAAGPAGAEQGCGRDGGLDVRGGGGQGSGQPSPTGLSRSTSAGQLCGWGDGGGGGGGVGPPTASGQGGGGGSVGGGGGGCCWHRGPLPSSPGSEAARLAAGGLLLVSTP